jgi:membrane protein
MCMALEGRKATGADVDQPALPDQPGDGSPTGRQFFPDERPPTGPRHRVRLRQIPLEEWPSLARRSLREAGRDRVTTVAGGLAFHGFLALVPVVFAVIGVLALVGLSPSALRTLLHDTNVLLPAQMFQVVNQELTHPASRGFHVGEVLIGAAIALWSSVEAMSALQIALDVGYEVPGDRGLIGRRLVALPLIVATAVLGGAASALVVLGAPLDRLLPRSFTAVRPEYHWTLTVVRYGGALILVMVLLSVYYRWGPSSEDASWEWISPGSVAAAVGWTLAATGFSYYLDHFGHEARDYGALAGAAVTLLWMFLTGVVVLLGAELNRELERRAEEREASVP